MFVNKAVRRFFDNVRRFTTRSDSQRIELVAWRPLHAGGVLYVADLVRRRHAVVLAPNAACLLASYVIEETGLPPRAATGVRDGSV